MLSATLRSAFCVFLTPPSPASPYPAPVYSFLLPPFQLPPPQSVLMCSTTFCNVLFPEVQQRLVTLPSSPLCKETGTAAPCNFVSVAGPLLDVFGSLLLRTGITSSAISGVFSEKIILVERIHSNHITGKSVNRFCFVFSAKYLHLKFECRG